MFPVRENNPAWKGEDVGYNGYNALHKWIRTQLPKPDLCSHCSLKPPRDLANITGIYNRDFSNWKYLCRKCHMTSDGRIYNFNLTKTIDMSDRRCSQCGSNETYIKHNDRPHWKHSRITGELLCTKCFDKERQVIDGPKISERRKKKRLAAK